jgi:hypothetical protein
MGSGPAGNPWGVKTHLVTPPFVLVDQSTEDLSTTQLRK